MILQASERLIQMGQRIAIRRTFGEQARQISELQRRLGSETELPKIPFIPPAPLIIRKLADQSLNTQTSVQPDDDFHWVVNEGEIWVVEMFLSVSTTATADFKVTIDMPTNATGRIFGTYYTGTGLVNAGNVSAPGTDISFSLAVGGTFCHLAAAFINEDNAGQAQLKWAQRVSDGVNTTVEKNSWMIARLVNKPLPAS